MGKARFAAVVVLAVLAGCPRGPQPRGTPGVPTARPAPAREIAEPVFDKGLLDPWTEDVAASARTPAPGKPAQLRLSAGKSWRLTHPHLSGVFGGLVFRLRMPPGEAELLEVGLEAQTDARAGTFPRVKVAAEHRTSEGGGWAEIFIPMRQLNPEHVAFDRLVFRAFRDVDAVTVEIDAVGLTRSDTEPPKDVDGGALPAVSRPANARTVPMFIDCRAAATKISPNIYGVAMNVVGEPKDSHQWRMGATIRRWGGNTMSRYNWELGAWNTGNDWFFENVSGTHHDAFLKANRTHNVKTALTIPMLGWVAKDTTSFGFPVSVHGEQTKTDAEWRPDAGSGIAKGGKPLKPGPPTRTSVASSPEFVRRWIESMRQGAAGRVVDQYILDNEPALWSSTHRDVHPDATTYDELLDKTIRYGTMIRAADPDAQIAGPAEWGWLAYFYSAKDSEAGLQYRPDRAAHGDVPLVAWYLRKLHEHELRTKVRVLDVLDLHFYPQGEGVGLGTEGKTDPATNELRLRQTRALWDPTYVDESWIKESVQLLPRMKDLVEKNYPGTGISVGEWNFGAEGHMSGGLAVAEALGRFAQAGVTSAYYWTYPPDGSPAQHGFLAYRDFDSRGGHFLEYAIPSTALSGTSLFASRDAAGTHMVAVLLNLSPETPVEARLDVSACGKIQQAAVYTYTGRGGFARTGTPPSSDARLPVILPTYSISVLDVRLGTPMSGALAK